MSDISHENDEKNAIQIENLITECKNKIYNKTLDSQFVAKFTNFLNSFNSEPEPDLENFFDNNLLFKNDLKALNITDRVFLDYQTMMLHYVVMRTDINNNISCKLYDKLSSKNRFKLNRQQFDLIKSFRVHLFPNEKIKSASLNVCFSFPKDKEARKKFKNSVITLTDDIFFGERAENELTKEYFQIKKVENIEGDSFKFSELPFCLPRYTPFSVSVEIESSQRHILSERAVEIEGYILDVLEDRKSLLEPVLSKVSLELLEISKLFA